MTDMERKTFCAALSRYGAQAQITMVFEEMAELQDVLLKLDGAISDADMARMNGAVEMEGREPKDVADAFLSERGLV